MIISHLSIYEERKYKEIQVRATDSYCVDGDVNHRLIAICFMTLKKL
jgi:hypothetical protein